MRFSRAVLIAAVLGLPADARADSDGYFCAARGYLAYETRFASGPARHVVHIVRFSSAAGIVRDEPVELDDCQVHAMRCRPNDIELIGSDATCVVDLGERRFVRRPIAPGSRISVPADNLGRLARPQVLDLEADGSDRFQLVIARVPAAGERHRTPRRHTVDPARR